MFEVSNEGGPLQAKCSTVCLFHGYKTGTVSHYSILCSPRFKCGWEIKDSNRQIERGIEFHKGRISAELTPHSGRPKTSCSEVNVNTVSKIICENQFISLQYHIPKISLRRILKDQLHMHQSHPRVFHTSWWRNRWRLAYQFVKCGWRKSKRSQISCLELWRVVKVG